jgi:FAD-dependent urate hydroxylase
MSTHPPVAIVGAGPYALATAAHLRHAGIEVQLYGEVMGFWRTMPAGMLLRSYRRASNISDPERRLTLAGFERATGRTVPSPIPLSDFIAYGEWFARETAVPVDPRFVTRLARAGDGFTLELAGGSAADADRVVLATGVAPYPWAPPLFDGLEPALVSHTWTHADYGAFRDRRVAVLGGGQSALEAAVLSHEAGAETELIVRAPLLRFLRGEQYYDTLGRLSGALYPGWGVGPPGLNRVMGRPALFRLLPAWLAAPLARRSIRPAGAAWIQPRLATGVRVTTGRMITGAAPSGDELRLTLDDGAERVVDHLLLGTGYRVDLARCDYLDDALRREIRLKGSFPRLSAGFESSVRGLHFAGAPAAASAGPGMRFVSHTDFFAEAITRALRGRA